tara:strand:- start:191 stop:592 length:402 start_codon:yes stop_codon:yes gene_type:complete
MAATVHSGDNANFSYTNSTGGNIRVIIGLVLSNKDVNTTSAGVKMRFGAPGSAYTMEATAGTSSAFTGFGKHMTWSSDQPADRWYALGGGGYANGSVFATEIWLADGHSIDIQGVNLSYPLKQYNILTIPEGN